MTIYNRHQDNPVTLVRRAGLSDVKPLERRTPDKQDRERAGMMAYFIVRSVDGHDQLADLAYLRADGGYSEIAAAIAAVDATPEGQANIDRIGTEVDEAEKAAARRKKARS